MQEDPQTGKVKMVPIDHGFGLPDRYGARILRNRMITEHNVLMSKDMSQQRDQLLGAKFEKLMAKMNRKLDAVPLEETEKKDLEEAFYSYFDFKEKTLPPEWFVGLAITNSIGKRAIDLFTD